MTPNAPEGFCFGRADFALWPVETPVLVERVNGLRPKLKRVLAVGSDVDAMNRLRELLAQAGVSTSIALDGRQAVEFVPMVQPEAVVVHLSSASGSVARVITTLRSKESTRDVPLLILLDQKSGAADEGFFNTTNRQLAIKGTFEFRGLPEEIARLIGEYQADPPVTPSPKTPGL
jgi:CheY-like chemotaxis protein